MVFSIFQLLQGISASTSGNSSSLSIPGHGYIPHEKQTSTSTGSGENGGGKPEQPSGSSSGGQTDTSQGSATTSKSDD
ncbi:hypothetical protein F5146DRAFT_1133908 [Armillaria mellea]|nr:hypothetical protein F5146DRAFT_1133908 [Armillaria mellea]